MPDDRPLSIWHDQGPAPDTRPALTGAREADVVIVGGGYTGLWTAYYLLQDQPDLEVVIVESRFCGFGASGRNGGWVSSKFPGSKAAMAAHHGPEAVVAYQRAMFESIDEIGRVAEAEGIDCDYRKGGMLLFATSEAQVPRLRAYMESLRRWGFAADEVEWLDADAARRRADVRGARAAMFTPHCASIHPWRLVSGLAKAVELRGATIYEHSPVRAIEAGMTVTDEGVVRAPTVLRCTEAFTADLAGHGRTLAPLYSLMIATEPLPEAWWEEVGLHHGETFSDERHLIVYGQRTADGRFAFGGRGAPYHFGSSVRPVWDVDERTHDNVRRVLWELFPQLGDARVTHRWGGAVAVPRDWRVSVDLDPATGLGHAGGYVGQGVTNANLAGRSLADLVAGTPSERTRLPFVGHRWRRWEPEPLRWAGINLGRALAPMADAVERRTQRPSRLIGGLLHKLTG
ncbi:MAG TPA: FAD-binding oxidoreductase [Acidimicrobiia bacterium]|nr:FAD-binding oxidoreductase [Acidimicrobiia bacterium]